MFKCRLDEVLKLRGLERKDFAKTIDIKRNSINDYCTNRRIPSVDKAIRIAQRLDATVEEIWYFEDDN